MGFSLLEHSLINCCTVQLNLSQMRRFGLKDRDSWERLFDSAFQKCAAMTLGNLIKHAIEIREFRDIQADLEKAKKIRDYFSHHFFRREAVHMASPELCVQLLSDIQDARQFVHQVELSTRPRQITYFTRIGLPHPDESQIDEGVQRMVKEEIVRFSSGEIPQGLARWLARGADI
jgi:hypothetical protein